MAKAIVIYISLSTYAHQNFFVVIKYKIKKSKCLSHSRYTWFIITLRNNNNNSMQNNLNNILE